MVGSLQDLRDMEHDHVDYDSVTGGVEDGKPPRPSWMQWDNVNALTFGVVFPAVAILAATIMNFESLWHMVVRRPAETLVEMLFILAVPVLNQRLWTAFARRDSRHPIRVSVYAGVSITVSLLIFAITCACIGTGYPMMDEGGVTHGHDYAFIATIALGSLVVGLACLELLRRTKLTHGARVKTIGYSLVGVLLTLIAGAACETQSFRVRLAEQTATTTEVEQERENALAFLRASNPDRDLWMDCADASTAGLAGLFMKFDAPTRAKLYFAATGKPYLEARTGDLDRMTDDSLSRHVIGQKIPKLSLRRSAITGYLHSNALVSTLDWTFVFKNEDYASQEARAEIALPQGGVVSGLTLWINGEPREAAFGNATTVTAAYRGINIQKRDPALVTDLGRGRILVQCSPVPARGEAKVRIQVTAPMKLDNLQESSLVLPRFVNSNFAVSGDHTLRLRSRQDFLTQFPGVHTVPTEDLHEFLLTGTLKDNDLSGSGIGLRVQHDPKAKTVLVMDPNPGAPARAVTSTIQETLAKAPQRVLVVIDGSQSISSYKQEILDALTTIPHHISTQVIVASQRTKKLQAVELDKFLENGKDLTFAGGQDNLEALIKAAELAGETKRSAVLWLHGPQPSFNREMYILAPYVATPQFYELPLDDGWTNTSEFLNNHKEIGPFTPIVRNASVKEDLQHFFSAWKPGTKQYVVTRAHTEVLPRVAWTNDKEIVGALSRLSIHDKCRVLLQEKRFDRCTELASAYRLVNKTTGAVVLERTGDYARYGLQDPNAEPGDEVAVANVATNGGTGNAPTLNGATNGSVGSMGQDATVIMGINTSGTVRVNNLANLEALLNMFANAIEILGLVGGLIQVVCAFAQRPLKGNFLGMEYNIGTTGRFVMGVAMILGGLAVPGMINWLVASARDANLFS